MTPVLARVTDRMEFPLIKMGKKVEGAHWRWLKLRI